MTPRKRFLIGGGGALMPVLVSFLAIDIGAALSNDANLTTANFIGIAMRYVILFLVGGVVAYLHEDEHKPFKLFELGIVAPALITSLITAQGVAVNPNKDSANQSVSISLSFIGTAQASDLDAPEKIMLADGFFSDLLKGIDGRVYRDVGKSTANARAEIEKPIDSAAVDTGKTIEKSAQDTGKATEKTSRNNQELIKARTEAAKLQAKANAAAQQVLLLEKSTQ